MPPTFGWDNFEDIAIALTDKFPNLSAFQNVRAASGKRITFCAAAVDAMTDRLAR